MLIIEPGTRFLLTIKLNNPSDTNTYYCQAKVYNSVSGALLSTVNLTDNGNKYFSKLWTAPSDGTVNGLQITVLTTAYTDSVYTQESTIYGTTLDNYIVRHLPTNNLGGFTTQLQAIAPDYQKIEAIVRKVVGEIEQKEDQEIPDFHPDLETKLDEHNERTDKAFAEVGEYVHDCMDQQSKDLTANFIKKLESIQAAVVSFLESHSKQDDQWDAKLEKQLVQLKSGIDTLIADETAEEKLDAIEDKMNKRHEEFLEKMEEPIYLKILANKIQREPKEDKKEAPEDQEAERQKMTIKKLLQLSQ